MGIVAFIAHLCSAPDFQHLYWFVMWSKSLMCITLGAHVQIIGQNCLLHNKKTEESNDLLVALPQIRFIITMIGNVLIL